MVAAAAAVPPLARACGYSALLAAWTQFFFLRPLSREARDMVRLSKKTCNGSRLFFESTHCWWYRLYFMSASHASFIALLYYHLSLHNFCLSQHERQMDPTEIVAVPYDLGRLFLYVAVVALGATAVCEPDPRAWPRALGMLARRSAALLGLFVLCGAPPRADILAHTMLAAVCLAALGWCDAPVFAAAAAPLGDDPAHPPPSLFEQFQQRLRARHVHHSTLPRQQRQQRLLQTIVLYSCTACTIPMQILLLYDRGWQLQRWPIPVILGSTVGWIGGTVLGTLVLATSNTALDRLFGAKKLEDPDASS